MKVKVTRLYPTLCDPVDYPIHEILQARIVEWVAFPFSRGSSLPRDGAQVPYCWHILCHVSQQGKPLDISTCLQNAPQVILICSLRWELLVGLIPGSRGLRSQRHHPLPRMYLKLSLCCSAASHVRLFLTLWTAAYQAPLSFIISQSLLKFMPIESLRLSNHLILCHPLLLLSSIKHGYSVNQLHQIPL